MLSRSLNALMSTLHPPLQADVLAARLERRRALRVELPFPVTVRGVDALDERFSVHTVLDNLSACGLYLRLPRAIAPGVSLFLVVRLAPAAADVTAPQIALRGTVLRVDPQDDGAYGVGVTFDRHRFLYADQG